MVRSKKTCGIVLQGITFLANGILWCFAVYASGFAIVIGLSTGTISTENGKLLDWITLTPATVFLFYGVPLLAITTLGCFASVSAHFITVIIYAVLLIVYLTYDVAFGVSLLASSSAYNKFIASLKESQNSYSTENFNYIGIIPIHPKTYWDHLQRRGKCCGLYSYEDWRNTSIATLTSSIPDSCCNELYEYPGCGQLLWKHPDHDQHTIESIVFDRGCLSIFPVFIQSDKDENIGHIGRFIATILFTAIIAALALFILVLTRAFRTSTGLNNPNFVDVPADPSLLIHRKARVHPETLTQADRDNSNMEYSDTKERKICFDVKGPVLI